MVQENATTFLSSTDSTINSTLLPRMPTTPCAPELQKLFLRLVCFVPCANRIHYGWPLTKNGVTTHRKTSEMVTPTCMTVAFLLLICPLYPPTVKICSLYPLSLSIDLYLCHVWIQVSTVLFTWAKQNHFVLDAPKKVQFIWTWRQFAFKLFPPVVCALSYPSVEHEHFFVATLSVIPNLCCTHSPQSCNLMKQNSDSWWAGGEVSVLHVWLKDKWT